MMRDYPTFNDVEAPVDEQLRLQNRANVIVNIVEDMSAMGFQQEECFVQVMDYIRTCGMETLTGELENEIRKVIDKRDKELYNV